MRERHWPEWDKLAHKQLEAPEDYTITFASFYDETIEDTEKFFKNLYGDEVMDEVDDDGFPVLDGFHTPDGFQLVDALNNAREESIRYPLGWIRVTLMPVDPEKEGKPIRGFIQTQ